MPTLVAVFHGLCPTHGLLARGEAPPLVNMFSYALPIQVIAGEGEIAGEG